MFEVAFKKRATKTLARRTPSERQRILRSLRALASDPDNTSLDIKPLQGRDGFRLRIGDWRVLYELDRGRLLILVLEIGQRGEVYK